MESKSPALLTVEGLKTQFSTDEGIVTAVDGASFELAAGETLAIVGESGSGKSVLSLSIARLLRQPAGRVVDGRITFAGVDLLSLPPGEMRKLRGARIGMVFQDPMTSLNPYLRVSTQLMEITRVHLGLSKSQAREHAINMLRLVGIPDAGRRLDSYPHEFSGGMRQRVMIAMALSCEPDLLIADEPTTALDVTVQADILDLIQNLRERLGTSIILVSHDLGVVAGIADEVIVMYAGKIFEKAKTVDLYDRPANPYTVGLLRSIPGQSHRRDEPLYHIPGMPPDLKDLPPGCPFAARCGWAREVCRQESPPFVQLTETHQSLCHFARDVYATPTPPTPAHR